jgi:L-serine/L-threonine ammonia-lyase
LGISAKIMVPETTPGRVIQLLKEEGASVEVTGTVWDETDATARAEAEMDPNCLYVHPFEHVDIWSGHASIVHELVEDLDGQAPDVIVVSVGGGGLFCGIVEGLKTVGWDSAVRVVAMETEGADCLNAAVQAGHRVTLPKITSIAKTLGALTVAQKALDYATGSQPEVEPRVVSDAHAASACVAFANDHRMAVEVSCGAALAAVYDKTIADEIVKGQVGSTVVIVVCGGNGVTMADLREWENQYKCPWKG